MKKKFLILAGTLLLFLFFFLVFYHIAFYCNSDIPLHAEGAILALKNGDLFRGNFLLYRLLNLCSGFSYGVRETLTVCCFLLAVSKVFLFWIVFSFLKEQFGTVLAFAISFSLLFVSVVPFDLFLGNLHFYLGYFVPNVWHNSTIIFSMPFSVLIYFYSLQIMKMAQWYQLMLLGLLVLICVFIKPSFFFVYSCSYSLIIVYNFWPDIMRIIKLSFPIIIGLGGVLYQFVTIYDGSDGSSVEFTSHYDYKFWLVFVIYFLFSMILPFMFLIVNYNRIKKDNEFWLVFLMLFFSVFIWLVFKEAGPREEHGNFYWQVVPSMWFMYFYIIKTELGFMKSGNTLIRSKKHILIIGCYVLTFVIGLFYLSSYLYSGYYS